MKLLIDGDIIVYQASLAISNAEYARYNLIERVHNIKSACECDDTLLFFSGKDNFRKKIDPEYKAHRPPKPELFQYVMKVAKETFNSITMDGCEADDGLGIYQNDDTIICSIDKDLIQIPGKHYRWPIKRDGKIVRQAQSLTVSHEDGLRFFYTQMLTGDNADNITGVHGLGPKKADALINPLNTEEEMKETVKSLYQDDDRFYKNADLLWIWRAPGITYSIREDMNE